MTTPSECTRALLQAGELLHELRMGRLTVDEAQRQALAVLRHYPDVSKIRLLAMRDNSQPRALLKPTENPS